jgi:hypothetical protein
MVQPFQPIYTEVITGPGGDLNGPVGVFGGGINYIKPISATTYTFIAGDSNQYILFTSNSPVTATVPRNTFVVGTIITAEQYGGGTITYIGDGVSTVTPAHSNGSRSVQALIQVLPNIWTLAGNSVP